MTVQRRCNNDARPFYSTSFRIASEDFFGEEIFLERCNRDCDSYDKFMEGGIEFVTFYNTIDIDCVGTLVWKLHNKMDWFSNFV